jgi:hypothetical protein
VVWVDLHVERWQAGMTPLQPAVGADSVRPAVAGTYEEGDRGRTPPPPEYWPTAVTLFRGNDPITVLAAIATAPIFLWELSLGVWLVVKGFKPSPITSGMVA